MSAATSPAAAISWSARRAGAVLVICGLAMTAVPVVAKGPVYIWRDHAGVVRFSPVPEAARTAQDATAASNARPAELPPASVITGASAERSY
jgi:hypothetical protein